MQIVVKSFYGCICVVHIDKKTFMSTYKETVDWSYDSDL